MSEIVIPFVMLGECGGVLLHDKNKTGDDSLFGTVGWNPLDAMPRHGLANAGYCRCGKGMHVFYWPTLDHLNLGAQTILRCIDYCGPGCKSHLTIGGIVRTYGGLLLALEDQNIEQQGELVEILRRDYLSRIAEKEIRLRDKFMLQLQQN